MPLLFVHLSDIHFGQERDSKLYVHNDVKEQLIQDAGEIVAALDPGRAQGIIVTGDIAFSGKWSQYEEAGEWLDRVAAAVQSERSAIQMVPGNHDIDRDKTSGSLELMLDAVRGYGVPKLDAFLANERDRTILYDRFVDYARFSEAYQCPLDTEAKYSTNYCVELAPGRSIRFIRINSALLCHGKETRGNPELIFGARQYVMPRTQGEEMIVLSHHPLEWFKDTPEAQNYIRSRARLFMWGHEHAADAQVDPVCSGCDLLMLAAGATIPPGSENYEYTYNIIEFDWDSEHDALVVKLHPRTWNPVSTRFEADKKRSTDGVNGFLLGSPNFRSCGDRERTAADLAELPVSQSLEAAEQEVILEVRAKESETAMAEGYPQILLRFFRDLTEGERLRVLVELSAIENQKDPMTQTVQRLVLDRLVKTGRFGEIDSLVRTVLAERKRGKDAIE